jgi:type IV pilus assembly protein PilW
MRKLIDRSFQTGFSLVELMVAMTIGLVLIAGITALTVNSRQTHRAVNETGQQLENGRYAMDILKEDLHHAGFFGEFVPCPPNQCRWPIAGTANVVIPAALPDPCDDKPATILGSLANGFVLPVTGYNNPAASPLGCIANFASGTDILVIRRADTNLTALASLTDTATLGNVYLQTGYDATLNPGYVIGTCSATACSGLRYSDYGMPPATPTTLAFGAPDAVFSLIQKNPASPPATAPANIRRYDLHIYFIRPWSASSSESPPIPTLARVVLGNSGTAPQMTTEALIEGIENLQVQYGIDDGTLPGIANDGAPDRYTAAPASIADWSNVVTVRINLLARKLAPDLGFTDTKTYDLGEGAITPGGNFKRHVFSNVVRLVNVGTRRE